MTVAHPERGEVATYGGPFDSYTIPEPDEDGHMRSERYDHDAGNWVEGGEPEPFALLTDTEHNQLWEDARQSAQLRDELAASQEREREVGEQLEFDRTALATAITGIKKAFDSRFWLTEGRGSYEWDDNRYRAEFREAYQEISHAIKPLRKIAADWTACPRKAEDVAQARIDLKLRAESAEERERVLREKLERVYRIASGEDQVAEDDTDGMAVIAAGVRALLVATPEGNK